MNTTETRRGGWIQTNSGGKFWPLDPCPLDFNINDIAHALSNTCRYNGHCVEFYSVAEHSYLIAEKMMEDGCEGYEIMWGLLHDAAESYISDVPKPIKAELGNYKDIEINIEKAMAVRYNLPWPMPHIVKVYDNKILLTEQNELMRGWNHLKENALDVPIQCHEPSMAKRLFLETFWKIDDKYAILH